VGANGVLDGDCGIPDGLDGHEGLLAMRLSY
jgi:hypothetical protein